jgi:murein L,D-transpeptidase YafK
MDRKTFLKSMGLGLISLSLAYPLKAASNLMTDLEARINEENPFGLNKNYNYSKDDLDKYLSWINQTIEESTKNGSYALIIDKSKYTFNILNGGKLHSRYNIELGSNPIDDKQIEGDGCTPEGIYKIVKKKDKGQTKFYRGLLINYPNNQDKQKFNELKKTGQISSSDKIGGSMEIHGMGTGYKGNDRGLNWTSGCIALSNSDMDKVFDIANIGTIVTIVKYGTL